MANTRPALPQSDLFLTYRSCVLIIGSFCAVAEHLCDTYLESEHQQDTYSYLCRTVRTWVCESPREVAVQRSVTDRGSEPCVPIRAHMST